MRMNVYSVFTLYSSLYRVSYHEYLILLLYIRILCLYLIFYILHLAFLGPHRVTIEVAEDGD